MSWRHTAAVCTIVLLGQSGSAPAQSSNIAAHVDTLYTAPRTTLDRSTGQLVSDVTIRLDNGSGYTFHEPLHAVVNIHSGLLNRVTMPGAQGGPGDPTYGTFYKDYATRVAGRSLASGGLAGVPLTFSRHKRVRFTYGVTPYGGTRQLNTPPILTVSPLTNIVAVGERATIRVSATDPEGASVLLTAGPVLINGAFAVTNGVAAAGTYAFDPAREQTGHHFISFEAQDEAGLRTARMAEILVTASNRPPTVTVPPSIALDEGSMTSIPVKASDPDGDDVTVTAHGLPENAVFVERPGSITFAPDYDQAGVYTITNRAFDGQIYSADATVVVTVNDVVTGADSNLLELVVDRVESPTLIERARITGTVNVQSNALPPRQMITTALINGMNPVNGPQGATNLTVVLTGPASGPFAPHFVSGVTSVDFNDGVTVRSLTVDGPNQLTAVLSIDSAALIGPRAVRAQTIAETAVSVLAFHVTKGEAIMKGTLTDSETGDAIENALITLEGSTLSVRTGADGSFVLRGVPAGEQTLIINPPNHEVIRVTVPVENGGMADVGTLGSDPTVIDPDTATAVSLFSVVNRGIGRVVGGMPFEDAKAMIRDTLLVVGGTEVGVFDDNGQQMNPDVAGLGELTLTAEGVRLLAQKMERGGETVSLAELLFAVSWGLRWEGSNRPALADWIQGLQEAVNEAWLDPGNPDNYMPVLVFCRGRTVTPEPPVISPATRLSAMQAYLFMSSLWVTLATPEHTRGITTRALGRGPRILPDDESPRRYTRYWRGMHDQKTFFAAGGPSGNIATTAFVNQLALMGNMCMPTPSLLGTYGNFLAHSPMLGPTANAMLGAFGTMGLAANVPDPPLLKTIKAEVEVDFHGDPRVIVTFRRSPSHFMQEAGDGNRFVYSLYRFGKAGGARELVSRIVVGPDTEIELTDALGMHAFKTPIHTLRKADPDQRRLFDTYEWPLVDEQPLPYETTPLGEKVRAPQMVWYYAITVTHSHDGDIDPEMLTLTAPWWTMPLGADEKGDYVSYYRRTQHVLTSDYSDPVIVRVTPEGEGGIQVDEIEIDPVDGHVYYSDTSGSAYERGFVVVSNTPTASRRLIAHSGFADPGQRGLAVDSMGNIISENAATDAMFGGRVYEYSRITGQRSHVGSINYYSRTIQFANPAAAGPMAMGPGMDPSSSSEDLFVVDELETTVKKIPVKATWDSYRRVGRRWADIPFNAASVDLEIRENGDADLLVERIAARGLIVHAGIAKLTVPVDETYELTARVENPASYSVTNIHPLPLIIRGDGFASEEIAVDPPSLDLGPGGSASFSYVFRAQDSGYIFYRAQVRGFDSAGVTVDSPLSREAWIEIGSGLKITSIRATPRQVPPGEAITVEVHLQNLGTSAVDNVHMTALDVVEARRLGDGPTGTAVRVKGPLPASDRIDGTGGEAVFEYEYDAGEMGYLAFEGKAAGVDAVSGRPVEAPKTISGNVLVSPLKGDIEVDPPIVPMREDTNSVVTISVVNAGSNTLIQVVPNLERVVGTSLGDFERIVLLSDSPVTLAPHGSTQFVYRLEKPIAIGRVDLEGGVTARTIRGQKVSTDVLEASVMVGPIIRGNVYDVVMEYDLAISNALGLVVRDGKDVPLSNLVVRARKPKSDEYFEAVTDAEGFFEIGVAGQPGDWFELSATNEQGIGFEFLTETYFDPDFKHVDVNLPVSLYNTTTQLMANHAEIWIEYDAESGTAGGGTKGDLLQRFKITYPMLVQAMDDYLNRQIEKGVDTPEYVSIYERPSSVQPNAWDAVIRLNMAMAFNLRRFDESQEMLKAVLSAIIEHLALKDKLEERLAFLDENNPLAGRSNIVEQFTQATDEILNVGNQTVEWQNYIVARVPALGDDNNDEALMEKLEGFRDKVQYGLTVLTATNDLAGWAANEIVAFGVAAVTKVVMQELYVDIATQPFLLNAVKASHDRQNIRGDTARILTEVNAFDDLLLEEGEWEKVLATVEAIRTHWTVEYLKWTVEQLQKVGGSVGNVAKKISNTLGSVGTLYARFLAAYDTIQLAIAVGEVSVNQPGRVGVTAKYGVDADFLYFDNKPLNYLTIPWEPEE